VTRGVSWLTAAIQRLGAEESPPRPLAPRAAYIRAAADCLVWGERLVDFDAVREAFGRDAGGEPGDVAYVSRPPDWRLQLMMPSVASRYVFFPFEARSEAVVIDVPPCRGARLAGAIIDAWGIPIVYVGFGGDDGGKGARYAVCGPDAKGMPGEDIRAVHSPTYNALALLRIIPRSESAVDAAQAVSLAKQVRCYPLSRARNPPRRRHIDIYGREFNGVPTMDATAFERLARMVGEEPFDAARDAGVLENLRAIRVEKGRRFAPSAQEWEWLARAADEAKASFASRWSVVTPWWPGRQWGVQPGVAFEGSFGLRNAERLDPGTRGVVQYLAYGSTQGLGAMFSVTVCRDAAGRLLRGEESYWLRIPAHVPARRHWSVSAYDLHTRSFIRHSQRQGVHKLEPGLEKNRDGSIDVFFGPARPGPGASNWIDTGPATHWFAMFRFHGPDNAVFEKTWRLPDIEPLATPPTPSGED
jgi:hypothetical protein